MRDQTVLRADVWRPGGNGPLPTLLQRLPYDKRAAMPSAVLPALEPARAAAAGFAVVIQDTRGRFASDGVFSPFAQEGRDTADTLAWIRRQSFSNGRIGMYGVSYGGVGQLLAAAALPSALGAIAPQMTGPDPYSWFWEGGALRLGFALWWSTSALARVEAARRRSRGVRVAHHAELDAALRDPWTALRTLPVTAHAALDELVPEYREWVTHPARDAYWSQYPALETFAHGACPALHIGGWHDLFLRGTLQAFTALGGRLIVGPWAHAVPHDAVGEVEYGPEAAQAAIALGSEQLRWFQQHLNGVEPVDAPPVRLFVMGANRWRDAGSWPPERVQPTALHLRADGRLSVEPPGPEEGSTTFTYDPHDPVPTNGGATFLPGLYVALHGGPRDEAAIAARRDVLTYTSEPFTRPTEITGDLTAHLYVATDAKDTDWTVKVVVLDARGVARGLTDGIVRARYRDGAGSARPPRMWEPHLVSIDAGATSLLLAPGERIGLQVSSSNFPKYDRNPNHGGDLATATEADFVVAHQTVFHERSRPSRIVLPLVT
jgi:uncharacterized protein